MTTKYLNIIILRSKLVEAINSCGVVVSNDSSGLPILKNVLIRVFEGKISFIATNLEIIADVSVTGKVVSEGEITVPCLVFSNIAKNLSSERVSLEQDGLKLKVLTDNYEAVVYGQSVDDFPVIKESAGAVKVFSASNSVLRNIFASTVIAVQLSELRPEISGVYVYNNGGQVVFVGTDSFRLAERSLNIEADDSCDFPGFIMPIKSVGDILRILPENDEETSFFIDDNQVILKNQTQKIISRLIDGNFPDYKQILPSEFAHEVRINRQEFLNAVKLVSSFSGKTSDVLVKIGEGKKFLEISSSNSALGENVYKIPAKVDGSVFTIALNWRYIADGLKGYRGDEVVLGVNNADKPATIKSPTEPFLVYIVMPIRS